MRAASAKLSGIGLSTLRAEYVHKYNSLLDRERQPHADFFINLSPDVEGELDFGEEDPFNLTKYDPHFEWDEAEYMKLRFIAARHYASRGHWDDAYAYVPLCLRMQNRRKKWNFLFNFRTMRKLSELYSGIFKTQSSRCVSDLDHFRNLKILNI